MFVEAYYLKSAAHSLWIHLNFAMNLPQCMTISLILSTKRSTIFHSCNKETTWLTLIKIIYTCSYLTLTIRSQALKEWEEHYVKE